MILMDLLSNYAYTLYYVHSRTYMGIFIFHGHRVIVKQAGDFFSHSYGQHRLSYFVLLWIRQCTGYLMVVTIPVLISTVSILYYVRCMVSSEGLQDSNSAW